MSEAFDIPLDPEPERPEFGHAVEHRPEACTPRELFVNLFTDLEEHIHFLEPAFEFVLDALERAEPARLTPAPPAVGVAAGIEAIDALVAWANAAGAPELPAGFGSSWPVRVVREFAPVGLADGAWLRGAMLANAVENEVGMRLLQQLMIRFGDPASSEAYVQRYSSLLKSLGTPPDIVTRWEWEESQPCTDVSYEHGLLGLCLGLFPTAFGPELLGFNLWMAAIGPCPLLERLAPRLRDRGACLRYFERHDRRGMQALAREAVEQALAADMDGRAARVARGFMAAHASYTRWEAAMLGGNVPVTPRDFVLEGIRRKSRFAAEHHGDVRVMGRNVRELFLSGPEGHALLLERLARSPLIRAGQPDQSRFMTHSLSIDGPMFDSFTAAEKLDLREWIISLAPPQPAVEKFLPLGLVGKYTCPQDPESLEQFALERFGDATNAELYYYFANSDRYPAVYRFARLFVGEVLGKLNEAFTEDPRLNSQDPPPYSERRIAELVAEAHEKNVRGRLEPSAPEAPTAAGNAAAGNTGDEAEEPAEYIGAIFDGCWLQGFADVRRADFEEYGWLFRIYASEHGDGSMAQNHCTIFRKEFVASLGPDMLLSKRDRRLYERFDVVIGSVAKMAIALNTRQFMPEILGMNLAIEASGVGGEYLERWKRAERGGREWEALAARLHNSIDNYADGHTKWSLSAVQAFMRRVKDGAPSQVDAQWKRIWQLWRVQDILEHGSEVERDALAQHLQLRSLAPTS
jgi:hypothetical protein